MRQQTVALPLTCLLLLSIAAAQQGASLPEQELFAKANAARGAHGLAPLAWDPALARAARTHAAYVSREPGELSHQYPGEPGLLDRVLQAGAHVTTVSENLARGAATPAQLQQTWMSTPVHRANLLDPEMSAIGIAVIERDGTLFAVEDFAHTVPALGEQAIERQVTQALRSRGLASVPPPEDDRRLCRDGKDLTEGALLVVQWDGPNPTSLPTALLQQLALRNYRAAAVAVCPRSQPNGAVSYHVTVLLH